jgi:hypothetical protein
MVQTNHFYRSGLVQVQHQFDGEHLAGASVRKCRAPGVKVLVSRVADESEGVIRLLHEVPHRVSHGRWKRCAATS